MKYVKLHKCKLKEDDEEYCSEYPIQESSDQHYWRESEKNYAQKSSHEDYKSQETPKRHTKLVQTLKKVLIMTRHKHSTQSQPTSIINDTTLLHNNDHN